MKNTVLLTATITPPANAAQLSRVDPSLRLQDYKTALAFYLEELRKGVISGLVFAENSNSDIRSLQSLAEAHPMKNAVEFISCQGLDYPPEYGRGYGEFKLVDYAMAHSRLVKAMAPSDRIWKITGRYCLENIEAILRTAPTDVDFYCNCRNHPKPWVDLYLLGWNTVGYVNLVNGVYEGIKEGAQNAGSAEEAFRGQIDRTTDGLRIGKRFRLVPVLKGFRGMDNKSYQDMRLKLFIRRVTLVVAPYWWI